MFLLKTKLPVLFLRRRCAGIAVPRRWGCAKVILILGARVAAAEVILIEEVAVRILTIVSETFV